MSKYSEQDLKYAAELREEIHREALAIVRKNRPNVTEVVDRHTVEDYFQENWDYPGKLYTIVAIPYGYGSRKALVDKIVCDTLSETAPESDDALPNEEDFGRPDAESDKAPKDNEETFYQLLAEYPDLVVDYCIVKDEEYRGFESHRKALKSACDIICKGWKCNPSQATGKKTTVGDLFSSDYQSKNHNYRRAFLYPPHENSYNGKDFARVNAALFPNGTDELEVYEWSTDWSDYFDEGHEWWGAMCLTAYDKTLNRFVVIMASATD
ncbi:MAG: hypothetical protein VZR54_01735 [Ruminococcus sp.]|nr:hypothetical protein [Ruminococcus sp.]